MLSLIISFSALVTILPFREGTPRRGLTLEELLIVSLPALAHTRLDFLAQT